MEALLPLHCVFSAQIPPPVLLRFLDLLYYTTRCPPARIQPSVPDTLWKIPGHGGSSFVKGGVQPQIPVLHLPPPGADVQAEVVVS